MSQKREYFKKAKAIFQRHGGVLRTSEAIRCGIHPRSLYGMRDAGIVEQLSRGLYRLADLPSLSNQDLVTVSLRVPNGIMCLISALAFHELTTQIPHEVYIALERGSEAPRLEHPPLRIYWFTGRAFTEGIRSYQVDGVSVRIYDPEKTIADCFKYRNKLGLDVAIEALRLWRRRKYYSIERLMNRARICRVERLIRPYLEALV
ncbi:MAG: type IV toxin-antitoxin system AbiEi family antitoxin domain-containing protein [Planctomycetes bacterium]|nr:type IV toxin-antitoxin system AbiEi family antitoxin domain-containing protein [Planctomycetota bacterium]MBL7147175.1 type IV toxin-antitoxin system AbiEi family antitoxin domain-containing protein [Phycisphaerae bacterium]